MGEECCYKIVKTKEEYEYTLETNKHVFVIYSASWCGPCRSFKTWLKETYPTYPHPVLVVDVEELEEIATEIRGLPTLIVFHQKEPILQTEGFNKQKLQPIFEEYDYKKEEEEIKDE